MRKVLKWIGIISGGFIGLLLLAAVFVAINSSSRINKIYGTPPDEVAIRAEAIVRACEAGLG